LREDELGAFEEWMVKYQGRDPSNLSAAELELWRDYYEEAKEFSTKTPKVGLMKLGPPEPGEHRYAVAIRDESGLWLTLWVRRNKKGHFFVLIPRGDRKYDPHASYHVNGTFHQKSYDRKLSIQRKQPLTGAFRGTETLGGYGGHGARIGAVCDPTDFNGVVEVAPDLLGERKGSVFVDLVEPGREPITCYNVIKKKIFTDTVPNVVIRISANPQSSDCLRDQFRL
jgi:hypothetical protein